MSRADLEQMARDGVVPILILYFFGRDISRSHVLEHREAWYFYLTKVAALAAIDYPVLVVLEPEFNDESNREDGLVLSWPGFNEIVIDGIYLLRSLAPNVLVGICPGDFGKQDLEPAIGEIVMYSDFIAFQQMRAHTRPSRVSEEYEDVTGRTIGYAARLSRLFEKPLLLAYFAVSTFDPENRRWEQYQADVVNNLFRAVPALRRHGVFGISYFMLFDDPKHTGYFLESEPHFGLVDSTGKPKPGWHAFQKAVSGLRDELTRIAKR